MLKGNGISARKSELHTEGRYLHLRSKRSLSSFSLKYPNSPVSIFSPHLPHLLVADNADAFRLAARIYGSGATEVDS